VVHGVVATVVVLVVTALVPVVTALVLVVTALDIACTRVRCCLRTRFLSRLFSPQQLITKHTC